MKLPAVATVEWKSAGGLTSLVYEEGGEAKPFFIVYHPSLSEDDPPIEGTLDEIVPRFKTFVEQHKLGDLVIGTLERTLEELLPLPLPSCQLTRQEIEAERERVRATRRSWLIREIEEGRYAAIELLQREFGETVKLHVEVISEAS
jgi:hypothetical protein